MPPARSEYDIAWICAKPIEGAAAKDMLDEKYEEIQAETGSKPLYTLGRISSYKVVIACAGYAGIGPAGRLATETWGTFPGLQFSLLVGIGGGIPSRRHDVWFGDVVVGYGNPAVVQYDFGEQVDGRFKRTGQLDNPPPKLHQVVTNIQSKSELHADVYESIRASIKSNPTFRSPEIEHDRLFRANYWHQQETEIPINEKDLMNCCKCDAVGYQVRKARSVEQPKIHFGLIASGNKIIKDAAERDELGRQEKAICIEMEAAGVDKMSCLVIRGICDYADSHKNDDWQSYAALAAATVAKTIICAIPLGDRSIHQTTTALNNRPQSGRSFDRECSQVASNSPNLQNWEEVILDSIKIPDANQGLLHLKKYNETMKAVKQEIKAADNHLTRVDKAKTPSDGKISVQEAIKHARCACGMIDHIPKEYRGQYNVQKLSCYANITYAHTLYEQLYILSQNGTPPIELMEDIFKQCYVRLTDGRMILENNLRESRRYDHWDKSAQRVEKGLRDIKYYLKRKKFLRLGWVSRKDVLKRDRL